MGLGREFSDMNGWELVKAPASIGSGVYGRKTVLDAAYPGRTRNLYGFVSNGHMAELSSAYRTSAVVERVFDWFDGLLPSERESYIVKPDFPKHI